MIIKILHYLDDNIVDYENSSDKNKDYIYELVLASITQVLNVFEKTF